MSFQPGQSGNPDGRPPAPAPSDTVRAGVVSCVEQGGAIDDALGKFRIAKGTAYRHDKPDDPDEGWALFWDEVRAASYSFNCDVSTKLACLALHGTDADMERTQFDALRFTAARRVPAWREQKEIGGIPEDQGGVQIQIVGLPMPGDE